ncbi:unnamed protein product, partial [Aphanomyces euteiches]
FDFCIHTGHFYLAAIQMDVTLSDWEDDEQEEEFAITSLLSDDEEDEVRNCKRGGSRPNFDTALDITPNLAARPLAAR